MNRPPIALGASGTIGLVGAFLILDDAYPHEGPWVEISPHYGIHVGDVVIVGIWAAISVGLWRWARRGGVNPR